ncbi:MAG: ABC transporter permease [Thermoanaerobaculia bacterium]
MSRTAQNIRYALRSFRRNPGFSIVAIGTLALAIGTTTAILSLARAALTKSLPYQDPERLVHIWVTSPNGEHEAAYPDYTDWRRNTLAFEDMGGYVGGQKGILRIGAETTPIRAATATASFFTTLGVAPILGRGFDSRDELPNSERVVLISHRLWTERFGADKGIAGRSIELNGMPRRVAGVLPALFNFAPAQGAEVWVNVRLDADRMRRNLWWLNVVARMKPDMSLRRAQMDLARVESQLERAYPDSHSGLGIKIVSLRDQILGEVRPILAALLGAVAAVLLIACANVAGLLLGRAATRRKEVAIRMAIGASSRDLLAQLLTESLTLSVMGGAIGVLGAQWGVRLLLAGIPESQAAMMPYLAHAGLDAQVLMGGIALSLGTGILFGLAPALQGSRPAPEEALKEGYPAGGRSRSRMRAALVASEIAVAIVLLTGAGLMLRSTLALLRVDPGFETKNLLTLQIALPSSGRYEGDDKLASFHDELMTRIQSVPGVKSVGTVSVLPLSGGGNTVNFAVEGRPVQPGNELEANIRTISPNYFHDMGIPLAAGRPFDSRDVRKAPRTVIVNRTLVRRFFADGNAIGRRIRFTFNDQQPFREIVGVVGDENQKSLDSDPAPVIYASFFQSLDNEMSVVVRTTGKPEDLAPSVKSAIRSLDRDIMVLEITTMGRLIADAPSTFLRRYPAFLIGVFAATALLLAAIGLYGIMAFAVSCRVREIGIRVALGAQRGDILRMVLGEGGRLVAAGLALGIVGALAATRLLSTILFRVRPFDPTTVAAVSALLALTALLAAYLPARRAAGVDPMVALREE